jgi:hypothetical protein
MSYACPSEAPRVGGSWGEGVGVGVLLVSTLNENKAVMSNKRHRF